MWRRYHLDSSCTDISGDKLARLQTKRFEHGFERESIREKLIFFLLVAQMRDTVGAMYSIGSLHMNEQKLYDQVEPIFNSSVPIKDVLWKTPPETMDD